MIMSAWRHDSGPAWNFLPYGSLTDLAHAFTVLEQLLEATLQPLNRTTTPWE